MDVDEATVRSMVEAGMTYRAVAAAAGISKSTVGRIMAGEVRHAREVTAPPAPVASAPMPSAPTPPRVTMAPAAPTRWGLLAELRSAEAEGARRADADWYRQEWMDVLARARQHGHAERWEANTAVASSAIEALATTPAPSRPLSAAGRRAAQVGALAAVAAGVVLRSPAVAVIGASMAAPAGGWATDAVRDTFGRRRTDTATPEHSTTEGSAQLALPMRPGPGHGGRLALGAGPAPLPTSPPPNKAGGYW